MINKLTSLPLLITGLAVSGLILSGIDSYPGSKLTYFIFSVSFWLMLLTSFNKRAHYGYLYLVVMLWLGFWVKLTIHLILDYPYMEPVGQFDESPEAWDEVLWVAIVASIGVMLGRLIFRTFSKTFSRMTPCELGAVPAWYPVVRLWVWLFAAAWIIGAAIANMTLGIQQIGLVPRTILPWPLNALIAWQVSIGSALLLTVLLWWEVTLRRNIAVSIYAPLLEAGISASSLLSRGVYVFHTLPQLFALFENRKLLNGLSKTKVAILLFSLGCLMILAIAGTTTFRAYLYPHVGGYTTAEQIRLTRLEVLEGGIAQVKVLIAKGESQEAHLQELLAEKAQLEESLGYSTKVSRAQETSLQMETKADQQLPSSNALNMSAEDGEVMNTANKVLHASSKVVDKELLLNEFTIQVGSGALQKILSLSVDRWIGLEGVMAVVGYPHKGANLLKEAALERREVSTATKFQTVANSHYRWTDSTNWQFASLPGSAAFLFFSGSMWVVLLGMALFIVVLQLSEQLVFKLTSNPLLCSLFGFTLANTIAQFGVAPRQDIPFYAMIVGFVLLVHVVQSEKIYGTVRKSINSLSDRSTD